MNETTIDMTALVQSIKHDMRIHVLEELYDWIIQKSRYYVTSFKLSYDLADDIAQDAAEKILRMPPYDIPGTKVILEKYIKDRAEYYNGYRRVSKNRKRNEGENAYEKIKYDIIYYDNGEYPYLEEQYGLFTESPEDEYLSNEEHHALLNAIQACNNSEILYERLILYLSPEEIQKRHHLCSNQYRGRYCRALDELRTKLKEINSN